MIEQASSLYAARKGKIRLAPSSEEAENIAQATLAAQNVLTTYLVQKSPEYRKLCDIRQKVSDDPCADNYYKRKQRQRTADPLQSQQDFYLKMHCQMCEKINQSKGILDSLTSSSKPSVLDMGVAPGGFAQCVLGFHPGAKITGISIPREDGGYPVRFHHENLASIFRDVSTLAGDLGVSSVPDGHPMADSLTTERLLPAGQRYDLIFCHQQPVKDPKTPQASEGNEKRPRQGEEQPEQRETWSNSRHYRRIQLAQLIIAMEHLKKNGIMVVLLRKPETLNTAELLKSFSKFSDISLFKHANCHARSPSCWMIVKNARMRTKAAVEAVKAWKQEWRDITLEDAGRAEEGEACAGDKTVENAEKFVGKFGPILLRLGRKPWSIQADALETLKREIGRKRK